MKKVLLKVTNSAYQYTTMSEGALKDLGITSHKYDRGVQMENDSVCTLLKVNHHSSQGTIYAVSQNGKHYLIAPNGCEVSDFN